MFVTGTTEIQFMAYLQLVRNRLKLLNIVLMYFSDIEENQSHQHHTPSNVETTNRKSTMWNCPNHTLITLDSNTLSRKICPSPYLPHNRLKLQKIPQAPHNITNDVGVEAWKIQLTENKSFPNLVKMLTSKQCIVTLNEDNKFCTTDFTDNIIQIQTIYTKLEKVSIVLNSAYGVQITTILIMKFTTLTSLLYFCCMIIIKYVFVSSDS